MSHLAKRLGLRAASVLAGVLASWALAAGASAAGPIKVALGPGTHAEALALGPDGNIWFGGVSFGPSGPPVDVVGKVTPSGAVTEYKLRVGSESELGVSAIAGGKEGRLWYTEPYANRVGRITTDGQFEDFTLIAPSSLPVAIAPGPDGRFWVAEEGTSRVAAIDPSGEVTEYHLPSGARPHGIAVGPAGNVWVTAPGLPGIAMIDSAGVVREFAMPAWNKRPQPASIAIGPDSNPWFSDEAGPWVGVLEPRNGSWEESSLEERRVAVDGSSDVLVSGPREDLWYTVGGRIGSLRSHGSVGALACAASGCGTPITALAADDEENLWYAPGISRGGGGGTQQLARFTSGTIGIFVPPPISSRIKTKRARLDGHGATIKIRCTGGAGGESALSTVKAYVRLGGRSRLVGSRPSKCGPATDRQFPLRLRGAAIQALRARGRLAVVVRIAFPGQKPVVGRVLILPAAKA